MITNRDEHEFYPKLQSRRHFKENETIKRYPGDKTYKTPEYSEKFHEIGSTRPKVSFGQNYTKKPITSAILIDKLPNVTADSNLYVTMGETIQKRKDMKKSEVEAEKLSGEMKEVEELENWRPATPLEPYHFDHLNRKYGPYSSGYVKKDTSGGAVWFWVG